MTMVMKMAIEIGCPDKIAFYRKQFAFYRKQGTYRMKRPSGERALLTGLFTLCLALPTSLWGADSHQSLTADQARAKAIYRELVEIDTTHSTGDTVQAAQAMAQHLLAAGFPAEDVRVIENAPRKGNLVARLRSAAPVKPPILFLAHIDVVEADPADWTLPPFEFTERDGYFYGRGVVDDKDEAAIAVANLIKLRKAGFEPNRDIIIALTADEEGGPHNGVQYLLENHRDLVDAAFVINEGGGGALRDGVPLVNSVQAAEKVYQSYYLEVTNKGGHSSLPREDNAIYQLAHALGEIAQFRFPVAFNEVTRTYFQRAADDLPSIDARALRRLLRNPSNRKLADRFVDTPAYNSRMRTTCVATQLQAGHAENALPQRARATVNCRILPGEDPADVQATLAGVIADDEITITAVQPANPSPASPLSEEVMAPIQEITSDMWPNLGTTPVMSTGATDGLFFRRAGIPVYGVSGVFTDIDDVRAHGRDERILVRSFFEGLEFQERLIRAYGTAN